jgi:hypothetical protein
MFAENSRARTKILRVMIRSEIMRSILARSCANRMHLGGETWGQTGKHGTGNLGTDGTFTDFHSSSDHLLREIYYNSWRK